MRILAVVLTLSVGVACGVGCGGSSRKANSPDDESSEEVVEDTPNEEAEPSAENDESSDEDKDKAAARPKKRRPKRRRHVEVAPPPEPAPVARKAPPPPPEEPMADEPAPAPAYVENTESAGEESLEAEARRRCRWKNVAPYRPEWANAMTPPLGHQRKLTSKPICPYGTPPAVLKVARQIAVQQTKMKQR